MKNLKIRVNSADESREAQELFQKLVGKENGFITMDKSIRWVVLYKGQVVQYEFLPSVELNEITITELRAMVNPMKEYLNANCNYEFVLSNKKYDGFIEIPEGAEIAIKFRYDPDEFGVIFYRNNGKSCFSQNDKAWQNDADWTMTDLLNKDYCEDGIDLSHDVLWQREQDEPFLTPECTLNDQYEEIEQVRQAIKVKSGSDSDHALDAMSFGLMGAGAAQASGGVDATLTERQSQYGCYEDVAHVTQQILSALRVGNYDELPAPMRESLHMIASKMARIVNGDPKYLDNWHDIGGYAKLIEKLIKGE